MSVHAPDALAVVDRISERLVAQFAGRADDATVHGIVVDSFRRYRHLDHPSQHARALTAHLARDRLEARDRASQASPNDESPSVLFVCTGNGGRSQLAAAIMRAVTPTATRVMSAGDRPVARILPAVIDSLDEIGVPLIGEYPKPLVPEFVDATDHIIVLNCADSLDALHGRAFRTWKISLENSTGKSGMRHTRDVIASQVQALARDLGLPFQPL